MIIFNEMGILTGFVGLMAGFVCFGMLRSMFPNWESATPLGMLFGILVASAIDLAYRFRKKEEDDAMRFFWPGSGGQIFFVPVWLFGPGVLLLYGLVVLFE